MGFRGSEEESCNLSFRRDWSVVTRHLHERYWSGGRNRVAEAECPGSRFAPLDRTYEDIKETIAELPVWEVKRRIKVFTTSMRIRIVARIQTSHSGTVKAVRMIMEAIFHFITEVVCELIEKLPKTGDVISERVIREDWRPGIHELPAEDNIEVRGMLRNNFRGSRAFSEVNY
jgi:hypothetical protein